MSNSSSLNEFLLLAFADTEELQLLHFAFFLGNYLAALLGNGLIITAVACDHRFHIPMYFFLLNLSLLDLGSISSTVCKSMSTSASKELMSNSSSFNEFLLLPFADTRELQLLHFALFLGIYLAALLGNSLIIAAVACDHHLHTPMYFFLLNLSLLDIGSISTTIPKSMANSLWNTRAISCLGCAAQVFLVLFLLGGEYFLLTVMAYDRFVAICKPLHYGTIMGSRACVKMAAAAWASGFLYSLLHTGNTFSIPLCQGNTVDQFFCEIPQILKLSCSDSYITEVGLIVVSSCLLFGCFIFIVLSYVQIFTAVLRIPSEQGRHKAFSMCLPHLAVVSLFISTVLFAYLKPPSLSSPAVDLVVAVLYSLVPPTLNPLIYSMRNKELKDAQGAEELPVVNED
ncbi:olfactory receptor 14A16-like [Apteryx mantelli]|uniref:Olfactory receptor n=1 Tax=Apteryx mantelli TaxID=2696672 RepID=A0ABM4G7E6_9AVES